MEHNPQIHNQLLADLPVLITKTIAHWRSMNKALPIKIPLIVLEDVDLAGFEALNLSLDGLNESLDFVIIGEQSATNTFKALCESLRKWLLFYRGMVRGSVPGTKWERWLVLTPQKHCKAELVRIAAWVTLLCWDSLEAELVSMGETPFRRHDGRGLAEFRAEVEGFFDVQIAMLNAQWEVAFAEVELAMALERLAAVVVRYPITVKCRLPAKHALLGSLPKR